MKAVNHIALIPAYEPEDVFIPLIEKLFDAGFLIVIVDDGSGPAYSEIFRKADKYAYVLHHKDNKGKGCALKTGLTYIAKYLPTDSVIVTVDADGQHKPEDAVRVCKAAEAAPGTLVLGCRHFTGNVPLRSRFGNTVTRFVYRSAAGIAVSDTQTGLRAFSAGLIPVLLSVEGSRYEYEMNMLLEFGRNKRPMKEVPIETVYLAGNTSSHFNTLRDSFLIYRDIFKFAGSSLIGFVIDYSLFSLLSAVLVFLGAACIPVSNVAARVISASANFTINKKFVFKNKDSALKTGFQYFILAGCILLGNTLLITFLVETLGVNRYIAKLVTEITFFTLSWLAQKFIIFRKKEEAELISLEEIPPLSNKFLSISK